MPDSHVDKRLQGFLRPLTSEGCEEPLEKIDSTNLSTRSDQDHAAFEGHAGFAVTGAIFFALLHALPVLVEVAYEFEKYGRTALALAGVAFVWMLAGTLEDCGSSRETCDGR